MERRGGVPKRDGLFEFIRTLNNSIFSKGTFKTLKSHTFAVRFTHFNHFSHSHAIHCISHAEKEGITNTEASFLPS